MTATRTREPWHATKSNNNNGTGDAAMLNTGNTHDRMRFVRVTMRARDMYEILCGMLDADTPEKLAALRKRAIGVRHEIESGQRCSATDYRSPA